MFCRAKFSVFFLFLSFGPAIAPGFNPHADQDSGRSSGLDALIGIDPKKYEEEMSKSFCWGETQSWDDICEKAQTIENCYADPATECVWHDGKDREHVEIWIIPHSHDDIGWLRTIDEYFVKDVRQIIDTSVHAVQNFPDRRYMQVEMAFFERWWDEYPESLHQGVREITRQGNLKFNIGGYCMHDEATSTYTAIIEQMTQGHQFILNEIGEHALPKFGWQIDPFGHSSVTPTFWSEFGMHGLGLNRIDVSDKDQRKKDKTLQFIYRGSNSLGEEVEIFTHIMDSHYSTPVDINLKDKKINLDENLTTLYLSTEIEDIAKNLVERIARNRKKWFRHNHVLLPFGDDFQHVHGFEDFRKMDDLINYVNKHSDRFRAHVRYGTFGEYIEALNKLEDIKWPVVENQDFFPYKSFNRSYWTGIAFGESYEPAKHTEDVRYFKLWV